MHKVKPELPAVFSWTVRGLVFLAALAFFYVSRLDFTFCMLYPKGPERPVYFALGWETIMPYRTFWAWDGLRFLPEISLAGISLIICLTLFIPYLLKKRMQDLSAKSCPDFTILKGSISAVAAIILFYLWRVPQNINRMFADYIGILESFTSGGVFESEILTFYWFRFFHGLLQWLAGSYDPAESMAISICVAGGIYLLGIFGYVRTAFIDRHEMILGACALSLTATLAMFFGHVETTFLMISLMTGYFSCASRILIPGNRARMTTWLACSLLLLTGAMLAHMGAVLLLPSLLVLLAGESAMRRQGDPVKTGMPSIINLILSMRNIMLIGCLVVLPLFLVAFIPYYFQGQTGTMGGGGDSIRFVPWNNDLYDPLKHYVHYNMLSWLHAADLFSSLLVAAPFAIPIIISCALLNRRITNSERSRETWLLRFTGTAAAGCLAIPILWNHDFGMWGDWNIVVAYLFPLNVFGWTCYFATIRKFQDSFDIHLKLTIPMILVQVVSACGLFIQLYKSFHPYA
jgi:hypothetical protein